MPFGEDLAKRDAIRCQCGFGTALGRLCGGLGKLLNLRINLGRLWETLGDSGGAFGEALGDSGGALGDGGGVFGKSLGGFGKLWGGFQSLSSPHAFVSSPIYKKKFAGPLASGVADPQSTVLPVLPVL